MKKNSLKMHRSLTLFPVIVPRNSLKVNEGGKFTESE